MAEGGQPTQQLPPVHPFPVEPDLLPVLLEQPLAPSVTQMQDPVQAAQVEVQLGQPLLNWSYIEPEFSGKPEDAEAHLLRTNDWMETHNFPDVAKVQRFCLTLMGEARFWYE